MPSFKEKLEQYRYRRGGDQDEHQRLLQEEIEDDPDILGASDKAEISPTTSSHNNLRSKRVKKSRKRSAETESTNSKSNGISAGFVKRKCIRPLRNLLKRPNRSPVWSFFTNVNINLANCNICGIEVQRSGGTSNLFEHLYRNHTAEYLLIRTKTTAKCHEKHDKPTPVQPARNSEPVQPQPTMEANEPVITCVQEVESNVSHIPKKSPALSMKAKFLNYFKALASYYDRNDPRKKRLDRFLAVMIARDFQPLDMVNDEGFKQFCFEMDPRYKLPCRTTLTTQILPELYTTLHSSIELLLKNASSISLTTDTWTSRTNQHYIGVTAHFIDVNFNLISVILTVRAMNGYSSDDFKDEIESIMKEFGISAKTSYITTDNASVMVATSDKLKLKHIGCYAHTLNLVVTDCISLQEKEKPIAMPIAENCANELEALEQRHKAHEEERKRLHDNQMKKTIKTIVEKAKAIVTFFHKSGPAANLLKTDMKNPKGLCLIQSVATRWNSLYYMFKRLEALEDSITTVLNKFEKAPPNLVRKEWNILQDIIKILAPMEDATQKISGSNYVTISKIIPINTGIKLKLSKVEQKLQPQESKWFCNALQESIKVRLDVYETRTGPRLATLLDPTIPKGAWSDEKNYTAAEQQLSNALQHELKIADEKRRNVISTTAEFDLPENSENLASEDDGDVLGYMKKMKEAEILEVGPQKNSFLADATLILKDYREAAKKVDVDSSPLDFWRKYDKSDELKVLALKYLAISGSSVPSERLFSTTGYIITDRRARLLPEHVDLLSFINKNYILIEF